MRTIQELLDERWKEKETTEAIMAVRAALQNLKNVAEGTAIEVKGILKGSSFASVHEDLKNEGQQCVDILDAVIATLAGHAEFIDFRPERG